MFILDYSVVIGGYRSDFTNTVCVGAPSDEQTLLAELCHAALDKGVADTPEKRERYLATAQEKADVLERLAGSPSPRASLAAEVLGEG
jgi:Xaa-Pro aminopeptidase